MVKSRLRLSKMSRGRAMIIYSECKITSKPSFETGHTASSVNLEGSDYGNRRSERLICYFLHIKSLEDQSVLKKTTLFLCEYWVVTVQHMQKKTHEENLIRRSLKFKMHEARPPRWCEEGEGRRQLEAHQTRRQTCCRQPFFSRFLGMSCTFLNLKCHTAKYWQQSFNNR